MLELVRSRPELQNAFGNWQFPLPRMPLALQLQAFAKIPGFLWPGLREGGPGPQHGLDLLLRAQIPSAGSAKCWKNCRDAQEMREDFMELQELLLVP